jgi:hypothetical protein
MIPKHSKAAIRFRFVAAGTCLGFFAGGAMMPELAGRASIMAALTASYLLAATARADDLPAREKRPGGTTASVPEDLDAFPRPALDATVTQSFAALTNEFKDQEFSASKDTATLTLAYAFGNTARRDWTAQMDLPVVHYDAGHVTGVESGTGIGDIEVRIGHVIRSEGIFRYAAGVEAEFDTAGGPPLGDGIFRLSPIVAFAVQPLPKFKFQTFVQFNQSLITETGVSEEQEIHLKPAVNLALPDSWYAYTEFEETWGFEALGEFSSTAKFEIGRGFGARGEWVLSARCELPITTSSDDYTLTAGCTYVFK